MKSTKMPKLYLLIEGYDVYDKRWMTEEEYTQEQEKTEILTDGNFHWIEAKPQPTTKPS